MINTSLKADLPAPCLCLLSLFVRDLGRLLPQKQQDPCGPENVSSLCSADRVCFYGLWVLMETPGKMVSSDGLAKHWAFKGIRGQIGMVSKDTSLVAWPLAETMSEPLAKTSLL